MPSQYCEVVHHFSSAGESAFTDGKGSTDNDIIYDEDDPDDVDEDGCPLNDDTDSTGDTLTGMGMRPSTLAETMSAHLQNEAVASPDVLLRDAAMSSDVSSLKEVMRNVSDINAADESGLTALHFAADRGSMGCLKLLVESGANVNAVCSHGIGVLQTALSSNANCVEAARMLLKAGADPDACDHDGYSPRLLVLEEGDNDMVDLFALFPKR